MKWILTAMLLLSAAPIFAQDSLAYEELPECFFDLDSIYILRLTELENSNIRKIGIDTCGSSAIIDLPYWPIPVNKNSSIRQLEGYRNQLLNNSKIYSNQIIGLAYDEHGKSIFKTNYATNELRQVSIADIKEEFVEIKESFGILKSKLGEFNIYIYGFKLSSENDYIPLSFALVFDHYTSVDFALKALEKVSISCDDVWFYSQPNSVFEELDYNIEINNGVITISSISLLTNIQVYSLNGTLVKSIGDLNDKRALINMNDLVQGVYFVRINNQIYKYVGVK